MNKFIKSSIFLSSIASGILLIAFYAFQWTLIDILTPFLIIFVQGPLALFYFITLIWSIIYLFTGRKEMRWFVIIPLLINILAILIIARVPFVEITIQRDFKGNLQQRMQVVQEIKSGNLKNNIDYNKNLIHLPYSYSGLSKGGNDIMIEKKDEKLNVLFFTFRGILDNFAGIIYKEDNTPPNPDNFNCGTLIESTKLDENWFWMSCT